METWNKVGVTLTLAALSVSASWAKGGNSFVAKARLSNENVVPSVLGTLNGELCLTIFRPPITTSQASGGETFAQVAQQALNPWQFSLGGRGDIDDIPIGNVRLYFGQSFANGQPILTLCDNDLDKDSDEDEDQCRPGDAFFTEIKGLDFDLDSVQFQPEQIDLITARPLVDNSGRLHNVPCGNSDMECGFSVVRELIKRRLIYVVFNSDFEAKRLEDGTIEYEPPEGPFVVDGDFRGTLRLTRSPCPPIPDPEPEK